MLERRLKTSILVILIFSSVLSSRPAHSEAIADIWFLQSGAVGDGKSLTSPIGSSITLERPSGPRDTIFLIPSEYALEG